jgi:nucleoid DNA-binding protein
MEEADKGTLSLKDVAERVSHSSGIVAKDCESIIKSVLEVVTSTIANGDKVTFTGT